MAINPPNLLSPVQTFRFLSELDRKHGTNYAPEVIGINFADDTNYMFFHAVSYRDVDAFAVRRFASLLYAQQHSNLDPDTFRRLTSALSTLLSSFKNMADDKVCKQRAFPVDIDLFDYIS